MSNLGISPALTEESRDASAVSSGHSATASAVQLPHVEEHAPVFDEEPKDAAAASDTATDYALPTFLGPPGNRVRRRSELAFTRAGKSSPSEEQGVSLELPAIPPDAIERSRRAQVPAELSSVAEELATKSPTARDPETPGESTAAQSLHYADGVALANVANVRTPAHRRLGMLHFVALCWSLFVEGWNDGSTGPLLPTIQDYYHINFAVVSTVFILNAIGFIAGAFTIVPLLARFGYGKTIVFGAVVQMLAYALQAPAGPFAIRVISFGLAGYGLSIQNALANTYVGCLKEDTAALFGVLHGSYGLGAFFAPLAATRFAQEIHWSYYYFLSLGFSVTTVVLLSAVFRFRSQEAILAEAGHSDNSDPANDSGGHYRTLLGIRAVYFLTAFITIYVGVEVTLGGWIVTYVIRQRQGGPSSGYISSGFFGGLTLGRVALLGLNKRIGESRALILYAVLCITLEITVWVVPSLIGNAVAVSLIGVLFGPMFPIAANHSTKILPRWLLSGALALITGFGQTGSALLPFVTGLFASKFGISSLQPLVVSMMGAMAFLWLLVPKSQRRFD